MRIFLFFSACALLFFSGCVSSPVSFKVAEVTQLGGNILANISFTGNSPPKETRAHLLAEDGEGGKLYDRDFWIFEKDFILKGEGMTVEKYLRGEKQAGLKYAKLELFFSNETITREFGNGAGTSTFFIEAIAHEKQYAIKVRLKDGSGKNIAKDADFSIDINDRYVNLHHSRKTLRKSDFTSGAAIMLVPYEKVNRSFFPNGTVTVTLNAYGKRLAKSAFVKLSEYSYGDKKEIEEKTFMENAVEINRNTSYVGFDFLVKRGGKISVFENNGFEDFVRFDVRVKNLRNSPQYLIRDDFYMRSPTISFYPVHATRSSPLGPLMKPFEETEASFYFLVFNNSDSAYSFYYGDKKLAGIIGIN